MKRLIFISCLGLMLLCACAWAQAACLECHPAFTSPMPPNAERGLACTACHQGNAGADQAQAAHRGMIANPSALEHAQRSCGGCHKGWTNRVRRSPMATAAGIINQTRYLWGAQDSANPLFGVKATVGLTPLPAPGQGGQLVDDFLRRRCLRCHLWSKGADTDGARRSAGCAACHRVFDTQGKPPQGHGLTDKIPVRQCLTCHAGCGAGAEFSGRTPRDAIASARFLATDPHRPSLSQARVWRPMQPDLHFKAGMACLDCHPRSEIMGDGKVRTAGLQHVGLRCRTCHGRLGQPPARAAIRTSLGARLRNVSWRGDELQLTRKLDSGAIKVPLLKAGAAAPVAHTAPGHEKIACHACHAAYNPAAWGMQVQLETRPVYHLWQPIAAQGDPQVLDLISRKMQLTPSQWSAPITRDYLSGQDRPGMWLVSPFFRRYAWRVYGKGPGGRSYLLSPRFQYVITELDRDGRLLRQAQTPSPGLGLTPWNPHTTARPTIGCADCHGSARALGLGLTFVPEPKEKNGAPRLAPRLWQAAREGMPQDWIQVVDVQGNPRQALLVPGSQPYDQDELRRMLLPGKAYKRWLLKALEQQWPDLKPPTSPTR